MPVCLGGHNLTMVKFISSPVEQDGIPFRLHLILYVMQFTRNLPQQRGEDETQKDAKIGSFAFICISNE